MHKYADGVFRSAITDDSGAVDPGYLSMFWALVGWSINNVAILVASTVAIDHANAAAVIQNTGVALGANAAGFAAVLGAVGLFRMGDKPRANTVTRQASETVTSSPASPKA